RLVYVNPADELRIVITPDKKTYRPGEEATVQFFVQDKTGHPVLAALGISIVDEAVFALQDMQPGLEKVYFTLEKEIMKPRYEIHGYSLEELVKHPQPPVIPLEQNTKADWTPLQQEAATVLLASAPEPQPFTLAINTFDQKELKYREQIQKRLDKDYQHIWKGIQAYYNKHSEYPTREQGIEILIKEGFLRETDLIDPWGVRYKAEPCSCGRFHSFRLLSAGPDTVWNTADDVTSPAGWDQFGEGVARQAVRRFLNARNGFLGDLAAHPEPMPIVAMKMAEERGIAKGEVGIAGSQPKEEIRLRMFFPETLYFNPAFITDATGKGTLKLTIADSITSWRMTTLGSALNGRMGSTSSPLRVFQDFFIDIDFPVALTQNDEISVPVAVYNYLPGAQTVRLELMPEPWFELKDEKIKTVKLEKDEVRAVYYSIKVKEIGYHKFTVYAYGSKLSDAIQRMIAVVPDGKEYQVSISDRLSKDIEKEITIPQEAIEKASKLQVKVYPGIFSQIVEGLASMLRMPFGCFEQTSSVTYPNILVLDYLKTTKQVTPEIQMKAEGFINAGYQRLLSYEVQGGGFEWFGNAPANKILTAWGVMEFSDMSKVFNVDPAIISRTQSWLIHQQNQDGSWTPDKSYLHAESWGKIQNSNLLVTAYITWALLATDMKSKEIEKAVEYLLQHSKEANDIYTQALLANALVCWKKDDSRTLGLLDKIVAQKIEQDGKVHWSSNVETVTFSRGDSADIESTALIAIALMNAGRYPDVTGKALNYIISKKDANGNWNSTQATILCLKALLMSLQGLTEKVNATVQVIVNGKEVSAFEITPANCDVMRQVDLKEPLVKRGKNTVVLKFQGQGSMLYQIVGTYYRPWRLEIPEHELLDISVTYDKTQLQKDDIITARIEVKNNRPTGTANMVIVDLGIPPGFDVLTPDLHELVTKDVIKKYNLTGRQIIVYLDKVEAGKPITFKYRLQAKYPIRAKTPQSKVYEYYNPQVASLSQPIELVVK
ncbi:MAG: type II secretion system protein GspG, partial [bacterium]|nr:type II secretion system protein GspG [bacterium]